MSRLKNIHLTGIVLLVCAFSRSHVPAQETSPAAPAASPAVPPKAEDKIPEIIGTWSRTESGTFSKLTIRPVENSEFLFFVEGADGNGLLEWPPANSNGRGFFAFNVLGDWTAQVTLLMGPMESMRLIVSPFEGQRKQLLRGDFAKTERELATMLSSDWTRVETPTQPIPMAIIAVVKTEFEPSRVRELLRAKYREQPYRFYSNDTYRSVIVLAPAEAQEDIEVQIHKLDVKEESNDRAAAPTIAPVAPTNPPQATSQIPDEVVPDISGTWSVAIWYQDKGKHEAVEAGDMEIRRLSPANFLIDQPGVEIAKRIFVQWSAPNRRFQGVWDDDDGGHSKMTLQPATDINTLHVIVTKTPSAKMTLKGGTSQGSAKKPMAQQWPQEWRRKSLTISTNLAANPSPSEGVGNTARVGRTSDVVTNARPLPDTPSAKKLVEQLGVQEAAAAVEAATIRQLPANGQVEQNQKPIAEHQRKLKILLGTAFDLKLQLEELQVKELQSRLSRLERQIGQRKELREKIVARRANELTEGDMLKWSPNAPAVSNENNNALPATGSSLQTPPAPPMSDPVPPADGASNKHDTTKSPDKLLDELLAVLQSDRDQRHVSQSLRQLRQLELGENAERVATAILASMEFHDPLTAPGATTVIPSHYATEALKTVARSAKVPALVKALRDGHPRVRLVAIWSLHGETSLWVYANEPGFPELAELLLKIATGNEALPRAATFGILTKPLPITKIDPAELTTEDRRAAVKRLATAIPRERVLQIITDSVSDQQIEVAMNAALLLLDLPEKLEDPKLVAMMIDVFAKITKGQFHDKQASRTQRGEAISGLAKLRGQSAPAVPMLIDLLQSDDPEFRVKPDPRGRFTEFTRDKVIITLGAIGPPAKDALPILEAELAVLDKKEREDALLSGTPERRTSFTVGGTTTSLLRMTIGVIKGERPATFFRDRNN